MEAGPSTLLGPGWRAVESFEDVDDIDEYETEEEEIYVTMDLGNTLDAKFIAQSGEYQLIGLDTPTPFLRVGPQIFQGQVEEMMGSEVIYGQVRDPNNPHNASHPPRHIVDHRLSFQPVTLRKRADEDEEELKTVQEAQVTNVSTKKSYKKTSVAKLIPVRGPKADAGETGFAETGYISGGEGGDDGYLEEPDLTEDNVDDYYAKQAEKQLINAAKERGEQPIMRTRKVNKKREPKAASSSTNKKKVKGKGKGKKVGSEESSAAMSE